MSTSIYKALKGNRKAMTSLYEQNSKRAFYLAECLLCDEGQAAGAVSSVFKKIWDGIAPAGVQTEADFTNLVVLRVAEHCKRVVTKRDNGAFRMPKNKDVIVAVPEDGKKNYANAAECATSRLPELQRFVLALRAVGGMNTAQIADVLKLDIKDVEAVINAEGENLKTVMNGMGWTPARAVEEIEEGTQSAVVPAKTSKQVAADIDAIAAPAEKKRNVITVAAVIAVILCAALIVVFVTRGGDDTTDTDFTSGTSDSDTDSTIGGEDTSDTDDAPAALDPSLVYYADIAIEDYGNITIKLDQENAPITAANFVSLAQSGFYDGLTFHRIMEGFMMQGGCPEGTGYGNSGKTIVGEFSVNGYDNKLSHTRGTVSMARSGASYDSGSCQFFIVHEDSTFLDGQYAAFGVVTEGMDVVDNVCESAEPTDSNGTIPASAQPKITSITIRTESAE